MNKKRNIVFGLVIAFLVGLMAVPAFAETLDVPGDYGSITEALAAADADDRINVSSSYDFDAAGEEFPILVQKDGITIDGNEATFDLDTAATSASLFTVGAKRYVDKDTGETVTETVSGVTIENFVIRGVTPVAFVVKHADSVTIEDNTINASAEGDYIQEGVRLIGATNSTVTNNTIIGMGGFPANNNGGDAGPGIGIFVQNSGPNNTLSGNEVSESGLGLFVYNSENNTVDGDTYDSNLFGGLVLNDSDENTLTGLSVFNNGDGDDKAWGVRFVHADNNTLADSEVYENNQGGIQLLGAQHNDVDGNLVHSNGTADDGNGDAQIVITKGDKEKVNATRELEHDWEDFVEQKHTVEDKLDLLNEWLDSLIVELEQIPKEIEDNNFEEAAARLRAILGNPGNQAYGRIFDIQTGSYQYQNTEGEGVIVDPKNYPYDAAKLNDPDRNFTLENTTVDDYLGREGFADDIDKWTDDTDGGTPGSSDWSGDNFALTYADDEYSWDKLGLIDMLIDAARYEIYDWDVTWGDPDQTRDSLMDMLFYFYDQDLITEQDYTDLGKKLVGAAPESVGEIGDLGGAANSLDTMAKYKDDGDVAATTDPSISYLEGGTSDIVDYVVGLYNEVESGDATAEEAWDVVDEVTALTEEIERYKGLVEEDLCRVDIELVPFPQLNTSMVAKKEKPFYEIGDGEFSYPDSLPSVPTNLGYTANTNTTYETLESSHNVIESNTITSRLSNADNNIGIVIESPWNEIVNNLISNEGGVLPDEEPSYEEVRPGLDFAMYLLSNNNLIAHNAIEFVDHGIIRGRAWKRDDYQLEYFATEFPLVAEWPYPDYYVEDTCGWHDADDFEIRPTDWIPVFNLDQVLLDDDSTSNPGPDKWIGFDDNVTVKGNNLNRNFFDNAGTGIEIVDAESNDIKSNLFYKVSSGNLIFGPEASSGIKLGQNDHYGGFAIINNSEYAVGAGEDYTPPEGEPGHAKTDTVDKRVTPPANDAPHAESNFQNEDAQSWYEDQGYGYIFNKKLPPNMDYIYDGVTLPDEKPRYAGEIFDSIPIPSGDNGEPGDETCFSVSGLWNLVSMPVAPSDDDPNTVFDEVPGTLYLWEYPDGSGWNTVEDGTLDSVDVYGGYYFWLPSDTSVTQICTAGSAVTGDNSINLDSAGWRLFGVPYEVNLVDDGDPDTGYVYLSDGNDEYYLSQAVNEGWLGDDRIWEYNANTQSFETATVNQDKVLEPDKGYWIFTGQNNLTMHFSTTEPSGGPGTPPTPGTATVALNRATVAGVNSSPPVPVEPAGDFSVDALQVKAVSQAETVTFQVSGDGAAFVGGVKVEVFDAGGRKIASLESGGNSVQWSISDVANGVYLYAASVNANGTYTQTNIDKLLLLK